MKHQVAIEIEEVAFVFAHAANLTCRSAVAHAALRSLKEESARSMAELYYNRLPAHVRESAALKNHDSKLWSVVKEFYRDIRNPLSHGDQLVNVRQESLRLAFEMFDSIYAWIDSWSDRNRVFRIMSSSTFQALK